MVWMWKTGQIRQRIVVKLVSGGINSRALFIAVLWLIDTCSEL